MIKEADTTLQTGVVYLRESANSSSAMPSGGLVSMHNPTFSVTGTGEDTRPKSDAQPTFHRDMLPYQLLTRTTGSELHDSLGWLAYLVHDVASESILTHYQVTFEIADLIQAKTHTPLINQPTSLDLGSTSEQAERLRDISDLTVERLGEIFSVSRTTYSKWLSGSPLHSTHREHLLEVLSLMEEVVKHLGGSSATNTWLLTPVSPGGKKPIEYLTEREYEAFRGFLLRTKTSRSGMFHPLISPSSRVHRKRSPEEREAMREQLRPKAWVEDDDENTSTRND